jgi:hypothetical protein
VLAKKDQVAAGGSNLSFALQKIPTKTVVSREQYTSSLSTDAPGQCRVSPVNSIHDTQLFFILEFKVTKFLVKFLAFWFSAVTIFTQIM